MLKVEAWDVLNNRGFISYEINKKKGLLIDNKVMFWGCGAPFKGPSFKRSSLRRVLTGPHKDVTTVLIGTLRRSL